jgi:hypothetical protein
MPQNKNALLRYVVIDNCLIGGNKATRIDIIKEISVKCGAISNRCFDDTIFDMRYCKMLNFNAPIIYKPKTGYFYGDVYYSIFNNLSSKYESRSLQYYKDQVAIEHDKESWLALLISTPPLVLDKYFDDAAKRHSVAHWHEGNRNKNQTTIKYENK